MDDYSEPYIILWDTFSYWDLNYLTECFKTGHTIKPRKQWLCLCTLWVSGSFLDELSEEPLKKKNSDSIKITFIFIIHLNVQITIYRNVKTQAYHYIEKYTQPVRKKKLVQSLEKSKFHWRNFSWTQMIAIKIKYTYMSISFSNGLER